MRYRTTETHGYRIGRLVIHWTGAITTLSILGHIFLELV